MPGTHYEDHWYRAIQAGMDGRMEGDVIFEHRGVVVHSDVERLMCAAEAWSLTNDDPKMLRKRLVNVLMEALENLSRHVERTHRHTIMARLSRTADSYRLVIGNAVPSAIAAVLMNRVEVLARMKPEELKDHNMLLLQCEGRTSHGGAGMGLVTMARKCNGRIVGNSYPIDGHSAFIALEFSVALELPQ